MGHFLGIIHDYSCSQIKQYFGQNSEMQNCWDYTDPTVEPCYLARVKNLFSFHSFHPVYNIFQRNLELQRKGIISRSMTAQNYYISTPILPRFQFSELWVEHLMQAAQPHYFRHPILSVPHTFRTPYFPHPIPPSWREIFLINAFIFLCLRISK